VKKIITTFVATLFLSMAMAQTAQEDKLFEKWEYYKAAQLYEQDAAKNPSQDLYYKLGECYQKMCKYKEARAAYRKVDSMGQYKNPEFYYRYAQILKNMGEYEKAKDVFNKYTALNAADPRGEFYMRSCDVVVQDGKTDLPVKLTNDSSLNSSADDSNPVVYGSDGLVFVSTRGSATHHKIYGWTGGYYMDVFFAKRGKKNTDFTLSSPLAASKIDQSYHDGPVAFSKKFDTIYFARVGKDLKGAEKTTLGIEQNKIFFSTLKDSVWTKPQPFFMNNDTFSVSHPFLTSDGKKIYFVSDKPGGYGETDIYFCEKEGKEWGQAKNAGPEINTFGREKYPFIDEEGRLYFSSDGYQGYGGLDLCVAEYHNGKFEKAQVLKAPINSSTDDFGMAFLQTGKSGYFSSNRYGGEGGDDIYYFDITKDSLPCEVLASTYVIGFDCNKNKKIDTIVPPDKGVFLPDTAKKIVMTYTDGKADKSIYILIHFDFNKYNILPEEAKKLDKVVAYMKENPKYTLEVTGHADSRGTDEYNQVLSENRALSTVKYLASRGIAKKRMSTKGKSFHQPVNRCVKDVECTEEEYRLNRRVEFKFTQ
jgi:outer membrane protein OmpA-like peptidoglycan-associated protein/tetratricopeptide (TPR) repeat protein